MTAALTRHAFAIIVLFAIAARTQIAHAQMQGSTVTTATRTGGGGTGGGTGASSTSSTTTSPPLSSSADGRGGGWFTVLSQLQDGEVELRSVRGGPRWDSFCDGAPVVVTRSLSIPANGACGEESWTNLSCSCVSDFKTNVSVWNFRVSKRNGQVPLVAPIPSSTTAVTAGGGAPVSISTIGAFTVPSYLTSLSLVGESATPLELEWDFKLHWNQLDTSVLVTSRDTASTALRSIDVSNLSLAGVNITADFVPAELINLTLSNCNIKWLHRGFLNKHHATLQRLVLAGNSLTRFDTQVPSTSGSALRELDLSNNKFTGIPSAVFRLPNLTEVNLRGNPITNLSVTASQFAQTTALSALKIDPINTATLACASGEWKTVASDVMLCVIPDHKESSSSLYVSVGIPVCVAVFAAAALAYRKRTSLWGVKKPHSSSLSLLESTGSQESMVIIDDALLKDPLLLLNRIPFKEIVVKQCVNRGGFGVVYSGVYRSRAVAIKRIRTEFNTDVLRIEAFLREICLIASFSHARIVDFIGVAWDSLQNLSAVTELMDQGDLRDVLQNHKKNGRSLSWDAHKMRIALHIAEALAYLHSLVPTVIHRDLKSKNVLLNTELDAKLSDFGISREWTVDDTHMTVGIGTSFWIAPEVLLGKKYDERADVFSFGVVLSELDTDDYPYWNAVNGAVDLNENAILRLVAVGQVRPTFTPSCPRAILELADLCLQGNPQHRPTSVQIVNVLRHLLAHGSGSAYPSSSQMSITDSISADSFY